MVRSAGSLVNLVQRRYGSARARACLADLLSGATIRPGQQPCPRLRALSLGQLAHPEYSRSSGTRSIGPRGPAAARGSCCLSVWLRERLDGGPLDIERPCPSLDPAHARAPESRFDPPEPCACRVRFPRQRLSEPDHATRIRPMDPTLRRPELSSFRSSWNVREQAVPGSRIRARPRTGSSFPAAACA